MTAWVSDIGWAKHFWLTYRLLCAAVVYFVTFSSCKPPAQSLAAHVNLPHLEELDKLLSGRVQIGMEVEFARIPMAYIIDQFDLDALITIHGKTVIDGYLNGYLDSPAAWEELKNTPGARNLVAQLTDGLSLQSLVSQATTAEAENAERGFGEEIMSGLRGASPSSRPDGVGGAPRSIILGPSGRPIQTADATILNPERRLNADAAAMEERFGIRSTGGAIHRSLATDWGILAGRWNELPNDAKREFANVHLLSLRKKIELVRDRLTKGHKEQRLKNAEAAPLKKDARPLLRRLGYDRDKDAIEWAHLDPVGSLVQFFTDVAALAKLGHVENLITDPLPIIGKGVASLQYHITVANEEGPEAFDTKVRLLNKLMMLEKLSAGILMDLGEEGWMTFQVDTSRKGHIRNLGNGEVEVRCTYQPLEESVRRNAEFFGLPGQIPRMQQSINELATPDILHKIRNRSPVFAAVFLPEFRRAGIDIEADLLRAYDNKEIDFWDVLHIGSYLGKEDSYFKDVSERGTLDAQRWGEAFQDKLHLSVGTSPGNATLLEIVLEFASSTPSNFDVVMILSTLAAERRNRSDAIPIIVKTLAADRMMAHPIYWTVLLDILTPSDSFTAEQLRSLIRTYLETESGELWTLIATLDRTANPFVNSVLLDSFRELPLAPTGTKVAERLREVAQVAPALAMELAFAQLAIADNFRATDILAMIATLGPQHKEFARALVDFYNKHQSPAFSRAFRRYLSSLNPVDCPFMTEELKRLQLTPLDVPMMRGVLKKFGVPLKPLAVSALKTWAANVCARLADEIIFPTDRD